MSAALILAAAAMGLAGAPHCAAMCGAACAAASGGARQGIGGPAAFQFGRLASYAAGGALAASSVASMAALAHIAPMVRPLWTLLHAAVLAIGLWMLVTGEMPGWMGRVGRPWRRQGLQPAGWQPVRGPVRSALRPAGLGALWVAWPCGLLQSALLVAALADTPWEGAAAMAAFALTSSLALMAGPALWLRLSRRGAASGAAANVSAWAARIAGASLAAASAWALGHGLWHKALAWCFGA